MSILKYCGLALMALAVIMILSEFKPKLAKIAANTIGLYLFSASASNLYPSLKTISELAADTPVAPYLPTILKALGVALVVEITADTCRDAGEPALASRLEIIGKAELLLIALPLVSELIGIARGIIS